MNWKLFLFFGLAFCFVSIWVGKAQEPTSHLIPFTGTIAGQSDGDVEITIRLYNEATNGNLVFQETQTVRVEDQIFNTLIGKETPGGIPLDIFKQNTSIYISFSLAIDAEREIGERTPIPSAGYAHFALNPAAALSCTDVRNCLPGSTVTGATSDHILRLENNGTGAGLISRANGNAVEGHALGGTGMAGRFTIDNAANMAVALFASTMGDGPAIQGSTNGNGVAGRFSVDNPGSSNSALLSTTNGSGSAMLGRNIGSGSAASFQIDNPGNTSAALIASTNSAGAGLLSTTSGSGNAGEFRITNPSNVGKALVATTMGTGSAAEFIIDNPDSKANTLVARNNGLGGGTTILGVSTGGTAVFGLNNGDGGAGLFRTDSPNNFWPTLSAITTGTGQAGDFRVDNASNNSSAVLASSNGTGSAGEFRVDNSSNTAPALFASTNGSGTAVVGTTNGAGSASDFRIANASNDRSALFAATNGTGSVGVFRIENASNDRSALFATTNGTGSVGDFRIANASNGRAALFASTNGTGSAGDFRIENASNGRTALYASTNSPAISASGVFGVVLADSGLGQGVFGEAFNRGVVGQPRATTGLAEGVRGQACCRAVVGVASATIGDAIGVIGVTNSPQGSGVVAVSAGESPLNPGLRVFGTFQATGTKSAAVPLPGGQHALLYSEESTEVWFSDYGSVPLVNGLAVVEIDPEFLQTVNTNKEYHVFITPRGNPVGTLYIDNQTPSSFEIRETSGAANIKVSYRIVAKRKDFADERLKKVALPSIEILDPVPRAKLER